MAIHNLRRRPDPQHHTDVERTTEVLSYHGGPKATGGFRAMCSCGWIGPFQLDNQSAENNATDHVVAATRG